MNVAAVFRNRTHAMRGAAIIGLAGITLAVAVSPAAANPVSREQDIVNLRLGQRVLVDDGTCPAGQIKEVLGAKLVAAGVLARRKCVSRAGSKK
jgi:hypothetical protein